MRLYMAANFDMLENLPFAWEHFLVFHIPPGERGRRSSNECFSLTKQVQQEFDRQRLHERAISLLKTALNDARSWNRTSVFKLRATVRLEQYDAKAAAFPLNLGNTPALGGMLSVARDAGPLKDLCRATAMPSSTPNDFRRQFEGVDTLPNQGLFSLQIEPERRVKSLPMERAVAEDFLRLRQTAGPGERDIVLEILVETAPAVYNRQARGAIPARVIAVRAIDQVRHSVLHIFALPAQLPTVSTSQPDSGTQLNSLQLSMLLLRDHSQLLSKERSLRMTEQLIRAEQACFKNIQTIRSSSEQINALQLDNRNPILTFEIQKLENERPELTHGPLLGVFRSPVADWSFLTKEPRYDARRGQVIEVFFFSEAHLGNRQPSFLAQELEPLFRRHSVAIANTAPTLLQATVSLPAVAYDFQAQAFRFRGAGNQNGASLFKPIARSAPAEVAGHSYFYEPPEQHGRPGPVETNKPGVAPIVECNALKTWRDLISEATFTGSSEHVVSPTLAFDRQLSLSELKFHPAEAERITKQLRRDGTGLSARLVFQIVKTIVGSDRSNERPAGYLLARTERIDILNRDDVVLTSLPIADFPTAQDNADKVAKDLASVGAQARTSLPEPVTFGPEIADLLIVKHRPDLVNEQFVWNMMIARREYERATDNPQYGRFFTRLQTTANKPDENLLRPVLSRFEQWTRDRATALPSKFTIAHAVKIESGKLGLGSCLSVSFANAMSGTDAANQHASDVAACKRRGGSNCDQIPRPVPVQSLDLDVNQCLGSALGRRSRGNRPDIIALSAPLPEPAIDANWNRTGGNIRREIDVLITSAEGNLPVLRFKATVEEVRFVESGSSLRLAVVTPSSLPIAAPTQPTEPTETAVPKQGGPDVLGLQIGMQFAEAEKIIRSHMNVGLTLVADRQWQTTVASGTILPFSSGRLFISQDEKELITIFDEPPAVPGVVMGVVRQVRFAKSQVPLLALVTELKNKYGQQPVVDNNMMGPGMLLWGRQFVRDDKTLAQGCIPIRNVSYKKIWRMPDGKPANHPLFRSRQDGSFPTLETEASLANHGRACGQGVVAYFDVTQSNWDALSVWLFDMTSYAAAIVASKKMPKGEVGADTAVKPPVGIKF